VFLVAWLLCFFLLFFFCFVADFYVIVGDGQPDSWKKSTPLSFPERFVLSAVFATLFSCILALVYAFFWIIQKLIRWRRSRKA
jgi:hypothetical protein